MRTLTRSCVPVLLVAATLLSACGTKPGYGEKTGNGLDSITVTGALGTAPTVGWDALRAYPSGTTVSVKTYITGTGVALPADHSVEAKIYVSDAQALLQKQALCSAAPAATTSSASASASTSCNSGWPVSGKAIDLAQVLQHKATVDIPAGDQSIFKDFLKGAHIGSRVAGLMGSRVIGALSGVQGADSIPSLGIGNNDAVLVIIDFLKVGAVDCPSSTTTPTVTDVPAAQLPAVVETAGKPTALKFAGVTDATCNGPVRRAVIKQGTGAAVGLTDTVTVNYFGEVFNGKAPFDESFTKKPYTLVLKQFVPGFANGLAGLKVGSRVVLAIPASAAYGNQSNSGIPASSSLYFVVDIVASK